MQPTRLQSITERASKTCGLTEEVLQSMSDFCFGEAKKEMSRFSNLRIVFPGLFAWFYGYKRLLNLQVRIDKAIENFDKRNPSHKRVSFICKMSMEELLDTKQRVSQLLDRYDTYKQERRDVKQKRNDDNDIQSFQC